MSIVEMQKIHIVSLKQNKNILLKVLQDNEVLDIQEALPEQEIKPSEEFSGLEMQLAEIKSAIAFLESVSARKKSFIESFLPPKEEIAEFELQKICREFDCDGLVKKCKQIEGTLANLKNLKNELQNNRDHLLPWANLNIPLDSQNCSSNTCLTFGRIKPKALPEFKQNLGKISSATQLDIIKQTKENTYLVLTFLKEESKLINDFIGKTVWSPLTLPTSPNTPAQEIKQINSLIIDTQKDINIQINEAKNLSAYLSKLKYSYDQVLGRKTNLETKQNLLNTNYAFIIAGWIKKHDFEKIKSTLSQATEEFDIFPVMPAKDEKPPIALENPVPFSPFELITKIYGTPKYNEWDPSIALSFFFALFFGICLGDFGYGLILAGFSIYFLKKYRLPEGGKNLFKLLLFGGGVAAVVGILTGSYLGLSPKDIPMALFPLKNLLTSIQIIDPIRSPLTMLLFSLALGVTQILFGIILQFALKLRNKDYVSAVLDDALWFFFLSSLVFLIISSVMSLTTAKIASYLSIGGAAALVLTQGRHKKNIIQKFLSGLLSLYKVSGYMGDTLSYSRLLALGMSTTIIGSVINILAGMVKGGVPILGVILMFVLLVVGHIFNLIIGTLGAFVHSTRLQMVEFFSKFYEGGGREFRPYRREAEYTILK